MPRHPSGSVGMFQSGAQIICVADLHVSQRCILQSAHCATGSYCRPNKRSVLAHADALRLRGGHRGGTDAHSTAAQCRRRPTACVPGATPLVPGRTHEVGPRRQMKTKSGPGS